MRQSDRHVLPKRCIEDRAIRLTETFGPQTRHDHGKRVGAMAPDIADDLRCPCALYRQGVIVALGVKARGAGSIAQQLCVDMLLDAAVRPVPHQVFQRCARFQGGTPRAVIHRPPVVGVDERKIPELGALVDVRHAWQGELEHRAREAVQRAEDGEASGEGADAFDERALRIEHRLQQLHSSLS